MQSRKQPSFLIRHSTAVHFIAYAGAIFVITPFNSKAMPVFVWMAMLIACAIIISSRIKPLTLLQLSQMEWGEYKKIAGSTLMSSLLFLTSCVAFKYFAGNGLELPSRSRSGRWDVSTIPSPSIWTPWMMTERKLRKRLSPLHVVYGC